MMVTMEKERISSKTCAERFGEAFPLGNGRIGAMVYGTAPEEKIVFTENTFFSGKKEDAAGPKDAAAFRKMREAAAVDNYEKVHLEARKFIGKRGNYGTALPVGTLYLHYGNENGVVRLAERSLDIGQGIASCRYESGGGFQIEETIFLSHPDHVFAMRIRGERPFDADIRWQGEQGSKETVYTESGIDFTEHAKETMHCDTQCGVTLSGKAWVSADGETHCGPGGLKAVRASELYVYLDMKTDFREKAGLEPEGTWRNIFLQKPAKRFGELMEDHAADIKAHMNRVSLELGETPEAERLVFLYQYGRYLLLSSSREDSVLPAHLQGIWNDNVACRIGWTCDMHLDINTQMNYWILNACRLRECAPALERWIEELLIPEGRKTAEAFYGLKGWAGEIVSNTFGYAQPYWAAPLAPCPTGGLWLITQLWENYLYTEEEDYLRAIAPVFREAALFFDGYVFETESGYYSCGPSISPENSFLWEGKTYQISSGCTYEILMIRELFDIYERMAERLGMRNDALLCSIAEKKKKLLPYRVSEDGTIAEYAADFAVPDKQHRHTSHLLGVFPFAQINPVDTPALCAAAGESIRQKLAPESGWEDTGWARCLLFLYECRLWNGKEAYRHLQALTHKLLEPNGLVYHPPTRGAGAFDHVYELDGNTGLTMGMTEMMMQSHLQFIHLLPAMPAELREGAVKGLLARGNIEVSFAWKDAAVLRAEFCAGKDKEIFVLANGEMFRVSLKAGQKKSIDCTKRSGAERGRI